MITTARKLTVTHLILENGTFKLIYSNELNYRDRYRDNSFNISLLKYIF